jgi:hypothetical protein
MKKEITWITSDGRAVVFCVTLKTEEKTSHYNDGNRTESTKAICKIEYSATVDGEDVGDSRLRTIKGHPVAVASIGKLGIAQVNYDRVMAAKAEVEASDYVVAWRAKEAQQDAELKAYYDHVARVEKMMGM